MADPYDTIAILVDPGQSAEKVREVTREVERLGDAVEKSRGRVKDQNTAQDELAERSGRSARGVLELSRAFQDFAQGGIAGILNNLEGVGRSLGDLVKLDLPTLAKVFTSPAGIAAGMTAVGTAAFFAWPHVRDFFQHLAGTDPKAIQEAAKAIAEVEKKTGELRKQLDELQGGSGARVEAAKAENRELERRVALEKVRAEAGDRAARQQHEAELALEKAKAGPTIEERRRAEEMKPLAERIAGFAGAAEAVRIEEALRGRVPAAPEVEAEQRARAAEARRREAEIQRGVQERAERMRMPAAPTLEEQRRLDAARLEIRTAENALGVARAEAVKRVAQRALAGDDAAIAQAVAALPEGDPLRQKLQPLVFGARFAAGARQFGRDVMGAGRAIVEAQLGRVGAVGDAVNRGLRDAATRRGDRVTELQRGVGDEMVDRWRAYQRRLTAAARGDTEAAAARRRDEQVKENNAARDSLERGRTATERERAAAGAEARAGRRARIAEAQEAQRRPREFQFGPGRPRLAAPEMRRGAVREVAMGAQAGAAILENQRQLAENQRAMIRLQQEQAKARRAIGQAAGALRQAAADQGKP